MGHGWKLGGRSTDSWISLSRSPVPSAAQRDKSSWALRFHYLLIVTKLVRLHQMFWPDSLFYYSNGLHSFRTSRHRIANDALKTNAPPRDAMHVITVLLHFAANQARSSPWNLFRPSCVSLLSSITPTSLTRRTA